MTSLAHWLKHRARVIGLSWPDGVADAAGIAPATLTRVDRDSALGPIGRGARSYLARTLKVSVRELEAIAAGKIDWIDDARQVDLDRFSPGVPTSPVPRAMPLHCARDRGIPRVGRIVAGGIVEPLETHAPEDQPRLALRYRDHPDAYAMRLAVDIPPWRTGVCLVFAPTAPGDLSRDQRALLSGIARDIDTLLCHVDAIADAMVHWRPVAAGEAIMRSSPLMDVLRAARIIGVWNDD